MIRKLTGVLIILILTLEVITYINLSKQGGDVGVDFDHWTGILGRVFAFSLFGFGPYLIIIFLNFFLGSGKSWYKLRLVSLMLGIIFLTMGIIGTLIDK